MLFESSDPKAWESALNLYVQALEAHAATKPGKDLKSLDEWYQLLLPTIVQSRAPPFLELEELKKLMAWKLNRGKFRPSLAQLAASNTKESVRTVSEEALKIVASGDLKKGVAKMSELRGVGPATASAILCAAYPDKVPFMADETMSSVPGLGAIAYTLPYYIKFAEKVIAKAQELAKLNSAVDSPHKVEMALWTEFMVEKYRIHSSSTSLFSSSIATTTTTTVSSKDLKDLVSKKKPATSTAVKKSIAEAASPSKAAAIKKTKDAPKRPAAAAPVVTLTEDGSVRRSKRVKS